MKLREAMEGFAAPFDAITSVDDTYSTIQPIKLVLAFSRDLQDYPEVESQVVEVRAAVAAQEESWTRYFTPNVESFNCKNTMEEDMYDPSQQGMVNEFGDAVRWVGGPNRQFEKMMRWVMENIPNAIVFNWATLFVLGFGCVAAPDFQARIFAAKDAKAVNVS